MPPGPELIDIFDYLLSVITFALGLFQMANRFPAFKIEKRVENFKKKQNVRNPNLKIIRFSISFPNVRAPAKMTRTKKTKYVSQATNQTLTSVSVSEVSGNPLDFFGLRAAQVFFVREEKVLSSRLIKTYVFICYLDQHRTAMF